jgi:hypothetical protein
MHSYPAKAVMFESPDRTTEMIINTRMVLSESENHHFKIVLERRIEATDEHLTLIRSGKSC